MHLIELFISRHFIKLLVLALILILEVRDYDLSVSLSDWPDDFEEGQLLLFLFRQVLAIEFDKLKEDCFEQGFHFLQCFVLLDFSFHFGCHEHESYKSVEN